MSSNNHHQPGIPAERRYAHIVGWGKYVPEKVMTGTGKILRCDGVNGVKDTDEKFKIGKIAGRRINYSKGGQACQSAVRTLEECGVDAERNRVL